MAKKKTIKTQKSKDGSQSYVRGETGAPKKRSGAEKAVDTAIKALRAQMRAGKITEEQARKASRMIGRAAAGAFIGKSEERAKERAKKKK